ncbi:exodeoxyribonuclease VII small subunit [Candidatus Zixiibacteriota bacterium]
MKFGEAVQRLEEIVKKLEQDEVALEESSELFEEGVKLAKFCSRRLNEAETKIEQLSRNGRDELTTSAAQGVDE